MFGMRELSDCIANLESSAEKGSGPNVTLLAGTMQEDQIGKANRDLPARRLK